MLAKLAPHAACWRSITPHVCRSASARAFAAAQTARRSCRNLKTDEERNRSPEKSRLEQCAPNLGSNGMHGHTKPHPVSTWLLAGCGIWLIALGLYFAVMRPPLLPEDPRFMGTTLAQIRAGVPGLENWLSRVFIVMGGFMAGAGVLTVFVATTTMRLRLRGTSAAVALSGALTVGLMSATNFALHSDFKWLLLIPALAWATGLVAHIAKH